MQVMQPGDQIHNQFKWCQVMVKFRTDQSGAIFGGQMAETNASSILGVKLYQPLKQTLSFVYWNEVHNTHLIEHVWKSENADFKETTKIQEQIEIHINKQV